VEPLEEPRDAAFVPPRPWQRSTADALLLREGGGPSTGSARKQAGGKGRVGGTPVGGGDTPGGGGGPTRGAPAAELGFDCCWALVGCVGFIVR
jgi:hypothetical protein